jgi:hypothetical protein
MRALRGNDEGSALVAAVGVAIIGIALCLVVVWQAVVVTQDAARDSVRTSQVHAAEAAVDAVIESFNVANQCGPITFDSIAQGTVAAKVVVEIAYADNSGPLTTCNNGVISGTPTRATVRATATPVNATAGIQPSRTVEAGVQLIPQVGHSAAIYSATQPQTGAGFSLGPLIPDDTANVWVNSGNFLCNTSVGIDGDLTVVTGGVTMNNNCFVTGSMWTKNTVTINTTHTGNRVGGDLTVQAGNLDLNNAGQRFGGDVILGGKVNGYHANTMVVGGGLYENQTVLEMTSVPLPIVGIVPSEWDGMIGPRDRTGFKNDLLSSGVVVGGINQYQTGQLDSCTIADWMANSKTNNKVVVRPPANVMYDLTGKSGAKCTSDKLVLQNVRFELSGDLVIFAKSFDAYNPVEVVSLDGAPHKVWFIVPHDQHSSMPAAYSHSGGGIHFHSQSNNFMDPIQVFLYSPGTIDFYNSTSTTGQIYGNQVNVHPTSTFKYSPIGIPGVDLATSTSVGSKVAIEYKRETS